MLTSTMATAGTLARTIASALAPSSASITSTESGFKKIFAIPRMVGLSSTIRTVGGKLHLARENLPHDAQIRRASQFFGRAVD
jgi:hypothetical protein